MKTVAFLVLLACLIGCTGCTREPRGVFLENLKMTITDAIRSAGPGQHLITIPLKIRGILVFASPHAMNKPPNELTSIVRPEVLAELEHRSALQERFQIYLIDEKRVIARTFWDPPPVVFNRVFVMDLRSAYGLELSVDEFKLLGTQPIHATNSSR